ncbi:MAG: hypothetical protein GY862_17150, partial [Gammaproteobacteria bacterium]|nr:hypothetical protein [Gammaproteobacteria bacterium]
MTALTKARNTKERQGRNLSDPVKGGVIIFQGSLYALDADGWAVPGQTATGLTVRGRAGDGIDNSAGTDGALSVPGMSGEFAWENSVGGDEITRAHIGGAVYVVDDQTLAATDGGGTRSSAGICTGVDEY